MDKLRDGEIRAYALWTWVSHEPSLKKAWKSKPADAEKMVQVNRDRFLGSPTWRTDITRWKWNSGDFYCGGNVKNRKKIYRRVRFAAEDVENLAGKMKNTLLEIKKSQGGRNLKINARDDVWLTVLRLYHTNGIDAFKPLGRSTENITKQTNWTNTQEILEYSSIEGIVKKVRKELNIARRGPSKS